MKKILAVSLIFFSVALSIIALAAPSTRSTLKGSKPSWAKSANLVSAAATSNQLGFRVYLGWNNAAGAEALARAVSDPRSSSYRHYLTPAQFRQQFAPTANQVAQVQSWLKSQGFSLVYTPKNNHYVSAQGTIAQAQAAFGTGFGTYNVNGLKLRSPSADVSIPSSLAGIVNAVVGLDQSYEFIHTNHIMDSNAPGAVGNAPPTAGFRNSPPLSAFYAQLLTQDVIPPYTPPPAAPGYSYPTGFTDNFVGKPTSSVPWTIKGHTPAMIKGAYGISSSYDGTGQTVAIIDAYASPTILADANQWSTNRGIPQFGTAGGGTFTQVVPPGIYNVKENSRQDPQGWYSEETLDVESVHGMAPNANIVYVAGPNNYQDLDSAMNHIVDNHLAQIVSNSYGFLGEVLPPGFILPFEQTLIQGAAEGIGIYFSSGDFGDESSIIGFASADWPASSPWVTAVGGTSLGVSSTNTRVVETGWGVSNYTCNTSTLNCTRTAWTSGSGGGVSCLFSRPSYQNGTVTITAGSTTQCNGFAGRGVPDIAALADAQTGYLVGQTQTFQSCNGTVVKYDEYRLGGTSLACPIIAGIMALSDQKAGLAGPHGFANPFFYANPGKFTDILPVKTAVGRRNFNNSVDTCNGTADRLRTFNDFSGSLSQSTGVGWDNVTGLGVPNGIP
jgi:subtilase family serine protease